MFFFQGDIRYLTDGLYPAPEFFEVGFATGEIRLKSSVFADALLTNTYFLKLLAYDTAYPLMRGTATATIFVNRNPNGPQFTSGACRASVAETNPIGSLVFNNTATDLDLVNVFVLFFCFVVIIEYL